MNRIAAVLRTGGRCAERRSPDAVRVRLPIYVAGMLMSQAKPPPDSLPTGEITLLFTDVVGSSRLWEEHGDRFIPIWQAHDAVLRDAIERFGGFEVKTEGDSFMVAFVNAADAIHCALFAQTALARYPWPSDIGPIRVRMGLHTGEPILHGKDYFGPVVNRAANVCKAAHGGQILATDATIARAGSRLDPKVQLCDLGDLRLKDMGAPQKLYEVRHSELEMRSFPPPRTLEGQPNNLPIQRTSFVGRAREIEQIAAYLAQGEKPVLTITGPSGVGKTRLTLQAAATHAEWFPDGVWYVRLEHATDLVGAAVEIAEALCIPLNPAQPALEQVRAWLSDRSCLLILDDANALPHADRLIREILSGSTGLRCLATARESLEIEEATNLHLAGLSTEPMSAIVPDQAVVPAWSEASPEEILISSEAGRLFVERASQVNPELELTPAESTAALKLVAWLEGVPDSIERAAHLMERFTPSVVLEELERRLKPTTPSATPGMEKFKGIMRRGAQKVRITMEEAARGQAAANLGKLLQGIANVATDRKDELQASQLGRESLQLSQDAGDELGMADALRQLARVKWQQGDRQSATAMLTAAAELYRHHQSAEYAVVQKELAQAQEGQSPPQQSVALTTTVENAVNLAMKESE